MLSCILVLTGEFIVKIFFRAISSLPFVGKFSIGKEVFEVYQSTSIEQRNKEYAEALFLLIIMVLGHAFQAMLGFGAMKLSAPFLAKAYFVLYTAANVGVTLTQIWLTWRVTKYHFSKPVAEELHMRFKPKPRDVMFAYVFTLTGQVIMMVLYSIYH